MSFFKELDGIIGTNTISITVTKSKDRLIVLVVPRDKDGDAVDDFIPMSVSGTPEQLDAGFLLSLNKSLELLAGIQSNLDDIEKAAVKTKEKTAKSKTTKPADKKVKEEATLPMTEEPSGDDDLPWEGGDVDTDTGEVKETPAAKPVKPATAKVAIPKEPVQATMIPEPDPEPEPPKAAEDEW